MADTTESCAGALLELIPRMMYALRARIRSGPDLSIPQFRTLAFVGRNPGCAVSDTAVHLGLTVPSASRLADGLIAAGLARRASHPGDRRRVALYLTASGRRRFEAARKQARAFLADKLQDLTAAERAQVLAAVHRLSLVFPSEVP